MLGANDDGRFIEDGFIAIPGAFSPETAAECRARVWAELAGRGIQEGRDVAGVERAILDAIATDAPVET